ncbi:MAG: site-2 protease family protein [Granulosicoccus sp.]
MAAAAVLEVQAIMLASDSKERFEEIWDRVAECCFRLSDCVAVHPVTYRGVEYFLLNNSLDGQQFRISAAIYCLIENMNGRRTLAQICSKHFVIASDSIEYQKKILESLTRLLSAGFLISNSPVDSEVVVSHRRRTRQMRKKARWTTWMSHRISLLDPDRVLSMMVPKIPWLFDMRVFYAALSVVVVTIVLGIMSLEPLIVFGSQRIGDPHHWMILILVYPLIKVLHELGHCVTAKYSGISIHEVGITFLVFIPVPYVNASSASTIESKRRRILISSAGIIVEVLLACLALLIWLMVPDGTVREIAYAVIVIGGVSTVLFNGNPLLKFDGYYILMDVIEIPNLASRSASYYRQLIRDYIFCLATSKQYMYQINECRWLLLYGAASTIYRIGICVVMALFFYLEIPVLGVVLALWIFLVQLLVPLLNFFGSLVSTSEVSECSLVRSSVLVVCISMLLLVTGLPVYSTTSFAEGIIMLPQRAIVRAETDGFLKKIYVEDNAKVKGGDILYELANPEIDTRVYLARSTVKEMELRFAMESFSDRTARKMQEERLKEARNNLLTLLKEKEKHVVRSTASGIARLSVGNDEIGRFVRQGDSLAYLADESTSIVRVVTTQKDAMRLRNSVRNVEVRLVTNSNEILPGRLLGEVPLGSDTLPSASLGIRSGGAIQVDARDTTGVTPLRRVFTFDVEIPASEKAAFVGSRALVRFHHGTSALLVDIYRSIRYMIFEKAGI